jgi:uncharacterized membrane protein
MGATLVIAGLWVLFAATHMGLSSLRLRPRLLAALGPTGFRGLYSLIALVTFTALVWIYLVHRHQGPCLWSLPIGTAGLWTIYALQGVAWTLIAAGSLQPSPVVTSAFAGAPGGPIEVRGVQRITRHAIFMGLGLFGALHLPVNGFASDVAFWSGFPLFALVGCWHQDRRKLASEGEAYRAWHAATPFLPFTGPETVRGLREFPPLALALGIGLATGLRLLHGPLFH